MHETTRLGTHKHMQFARLYSVNLHAATKLAFLLFYLITF